METEHLRRRPQSPSGCEPVRLRGNVLSLLSGPSDGVLDLAGRDSGVAGLVYKRVGEPQTKNDKAEDRNELNYGFAQLLLGKKPAFSNDVSQGVSWRSRHLSFKHRVLLQGRAKLTQHFMSS